MPMALMLTLLLADLPAPPPPALAQAHDLAALTPDGALVGRPARFVFTPGSLPDEAQGRCWCVEAEGADGHTGRHGVRPQGNRVKASPE